MEISPNENRKLDSLLASWSEHSEEELEATFGGNNDGTNIDSTIFLAVAKRLAAKGFQARPQEDRLNIITPNQVRITLTGLGTIQQYCKDDTLTSKPFTAMIKDTTREEANLFLTEYDTKIKLRRELILGQDDFRLRDTITNWPQQRKAFRLIKRWSYASQGVVIDMSIVRMTPRKDGKFIWQKSFGEKDLFRQPPVYEIEVELVRGEDTKNTNDAKRALIRGIGEILRAIQKNFILVRNSVRSEVLRQYRNLVKSDKFRGVPPVTLEKQNMIYVRPGDLEDEDKIPNIRGNYNVTDKADGLRVMPFVDKDGDLYMLDMGLNVYRTGLRNGACKNSLLDAEWVTLDKEGRAINLLLIFDIYVVSNSSGETRDVSRLPFWDVNPDQETRYNTLKNWMEFWVRTEQITSKLVTDNNRLQISIKNFYFAGGATSATTPESLEIFAHCSRILNTPMIYHTDGLILTPNNLPLPSRPGEVFPQQFKWKPSNQNTVDFLVTYEKDLDIPTIDRTVTGVYPTTGETIRYKIMRLFVGSSKDISYEDPRATILNMAKLPDGPRRGAQAAGAVYKPILFSPQEFPDTMASTCYHTVEIDSETGEEFVVTEEGEAIRDRSIVEMRYDPTRPQGWRWIPMRIRHDKTERLMRGRIERTLNSEKVAESVWNSIHDPVTQYMISTGSDSPSEAEERAMHPQGTGSTAEVGLKYYDRKASDEDLMVVRGLRNFHNKYIKEQIIYRSILRKRRVSLIDYTCGKGADLQRWRRGGVSFVLGLDKAGDNIRDKNNGIYRRYMDTLINNGRDKVAQMVFSIADSSKDIVTGLAGGTQEEGDILRAVFGRAEVEATVPKYIETEVAGRLRNGADCGVAMFSLHYFFENKEILDGFLGNLATTIKEGGYFAGCCFDGEAVFNYLRGIGQGGNRIGKVGDEIVWSITKKYSADSFDADETSLGMPIDVEFITIGTPHVEYLVNFTYLMRRLRDIGFELLDETEMSEAGLKFSTNMFGASFEMAEGLGRKFQMDDDVKTFSFLNRWFIFQRRGAEVVGAVAAAEAEAPVSAVASAAAVAAAANTTGKTVSVREAAPPALAAELPATSAAAASASSIEGRKYLKAQVYQFYLDAPLEVMAKNKKLKDTSIKDIQDAPRRLDPGWPFDIPERDGYIIYPSIDHYLAAQFLKLAAGKPDLARSLLSKEGSIHQTYLQEARDSARTPDVLHDIQKREIEAVRALYYPSATRKRTLNGLKVKSLNEAAWNVAKDAEIEYAVGVRWTSDDKFHKIVEAARTEGKYLLFYIPGRTVEELGGRLTADGRINGENKIGRTIMKVANYSS